MRRDLALKSHSRMSLLFNKALKDNTNTSQICFNPPRKRANLTISWGTKAPKRRCKTPRFWAFLATNSTRTAVRTWECIRTCFLTPKLRAPKILTQFNKMLTWRIYHNKIRMLTWRRSTLRKSLRMSLWSKLIKRGWKMIHFCSSLWNQSKKRGRNFSRQLTDIKQNMLLSGTEAHPRAKAHNGSTKPLTPPILGFLMFKDQMNQVITWMIEPMFLTSIQTANTDFKIDSDRGLLILI